MENRQCLQGHSLGVGGAGRATLPTGRKGFSLLTVESSSLCKASKKGGWASWRRRPFKFPCLLPHWPGQAVGSEGGTG